MRAVCCKGLVTIIIGSTLVHLVHTCRVLGAGMGQRMGAINSHRRKYDQDYGVDYTMPDLELSNLYLGGYRANMACMSGPLVKAANTRGLYEFSKLLAFELLAGDDQESTSIRKIHESLRIVLRVLYCNEMFLNGEQLASVRKHTWRLGRHLKWLSYHPATQTGIRAWLVTPEGHFSSTYLSSASSSICGICNDTSKNLRAAALRRSTSLRRTGRAPLRHCNASS